MDLNFFFGRFHIVLIHLPIGLLLLAAAMYFLSPKEQFQKLNAAVSFTLFWGAITAILAAICGWLLANTGVYAEQSLFVHRWLGISVAVVAIFCWLAKKGTVKIKKRSFSFSMIILVLLIFSTGHFGGNLTHGEGYLIKYGPSFLKNFFGFRSTAVLSKEQFPNPDSTFVFKNLILPSLKEKCGDCHNEKNKDGGLVLITKKGFLEGGDHDEIFVSKNAFESEIFKRITLPRSDERFMPPKGKVLSYDEIRLLEWWINEGADFEKPVSEYNLTNDIEMLLAKNYGLDFGSKSLIETIEVSPLSNAVFSVLDANGFKVVQLAANNNLLEVSLKSGMEKISLDEFNTLLEAKEQVTWLNLGNTKIEDAHLEIIGQLHNLTRLRLEQTLITDKGVTQLEKLPNLESLNLYGTAISDKAINSFSKISSLKKVYLWQTKMTPEGIDRFKASRPDLEVISGIAVSK